MKRTVFLLPAIVFILISTSCGRSTPTETAIDVYCYDSFSSEWGPGPAIAAAFEEQEGIKVTFHAPGDAVSVLNQLILEKDDPRADVVIGLDDSLLGRALDSGVLVPYESPELDSVPDHLVFDPSHHLLPYDHGHFAINYDSEAVESPPTSLEDLTDPRFRESLVLMDPRTSTPGLGFLLWTVQIYGNSWPEYWSRLRPSILTVSDGWSQGYALFTAGEASMVLSYGTSPAYHAEYESTDRYRAIEFSDGHLRQVEGMGIVSGTEERDAAERFIDFMLTAESQSTVALSNIMLPARSDVDLPPSFDLALRPDQVLTTPPASDELIDRWVEIFAE